MNRLDNIDGHTQSLYRKKKKQPIISSHEPFYPNLTKKLKNPLCVPDIHVAQQFPMENVFCLVIKI